MKYVLVTTLVIAILCAAIGVGIPSLSGDRGAAIKVAQAQAQAEAERAKQAQAQQAIEEARARASIAETAADSLEKVTLINALADENRLNGDALRLIATEDVRRRDALRSAGFIVLVCIALGGSFAVVRARQHMMVG